MTQIGQKLLSAGMSNAVGALCLALVVVAVTRACRRPALAHALWLIVLLKFVSPTIWELPLPSMAPSPERVANDNSDMLAREGAELFSRRAEPAQPAVEVASAADRAGRPSSEFQVIEDFEAPRPPIRPEIPGIAFLWQAVARWSRPITTVWICGSTIWFALVAIRLRRLARLLRRTDEADEALRAEVAGVAALVDLRRAPRVRVVRAIVPPFVWSLFGKTVLVLPSDLVESLDADERRTLLAHELAHLCRRDHHVRWLELVVVGLFWWQPVAWHARRRIQIAAEECCDAFVVRRFPEHARAYARALLKTVDFLADDNHAAPIAGTAFGQLYSIQRRFEMILHGCAFDRLPRASAWMVALLGLVLLPISIGSLRADEPEPAEAPAANAPNEIDKAPDLQALAEQSAQLSAEVKRTIDSLSGASAVTVGGAPAVAIDFPASDLEARLRRLEETVAALKDTQPSSPAAAGPRDAREISDRMARHPELFSMRKAPEGAKVEPFYEKTLKSVERQTQLLATNKSRLEAAQINLTAVEAAYESGKITLDLLLDAQRRLLTCEVDFAHSTLQLAGFLPERERQQILARSTLDAHIKARNSALATWRKVKALYDANAKGGEAAQETQAREQYFLFRGQTEHALEQLQQAADAK